LFSLSLSAEPPGCSSPSLSLLDAMAALLLLAPERLRSVGILLQLASRLARFRK